LNSDEMLVNVSSVKLGSPDAVVSCVSPVKVAIMNCDSYRPGRATNKLRLHAGAGYDSSADRTAIIVRPINEHMT
jgi:hypothetical protein